ncbi:MULTISPECIES: FAD-binding protein [unclassified Nocardia]|uniref:FAD-binding protein n=1 Tax=unclassified Nocardia TaxID=2637762 RepID=UPI001CE44854|nr:MULTISPECIES: FAD-binding protein [unclassified Nocardia]
MDRRRFVTAFLAAFGLAAAGKASAMPGLPELPGLFDPMQPLLAESAAGGMTRDILLRRLLDFVDAHPELASLDQLPPQVRAVAEHLRAGGDIVSAPGGAFPPSPPTVELQRWLLNNASGHPEVSESDGTPMGCVFAHDFANWGLTVGNRPAVTFLPRTRGGIQNLVRWAREHDKRVRVAGYRHSWTDIFGEDGCVLISLLPLREAEQIPSFPTPLDPANELQGINIVGTIAEDGVTKALCRIGAGTTNEQFRQWCLSDSGGRWQWTLPLNVIMVEITYGGSNGPMCHGAGLRNRTLSDLVHEIEFVNANGEFQTVSDPELLRAAAGCFGLLGVVTSLTLKLDPMSFADMRPVKQSILLTVPPPPGFPIPPALADPAVTPDQMEAARVDFERRCAEDFYSEWFWFPYHREGWTHSWNNDAPRAAAVDYPSPPEALQQWLESWIASGINDFPPFQALPGPTQASFLANTAMIQLPGVEDFEPSIVAPLIDALHFRRGIQNWRVLDVELLIPIPARADDPTRPDWDVCRRAWWNAIDEVYRWPEGPMRIALEMRVMGDSAMDLAPERGNTFGTCSIEVLTSLHTPEPLWNAFTQAITDRWCSETDHLGNPLNVRPHWAKQWQHLTFRGRPAEDYLKNVAYPQQFADFKSRMSRIHAQGGVSSADSYRRFSNPLFDRLLDL